MLATLVERTIVRQERDFGQKMDYLRDIAGASLVGFAKYALFIPMSRHRTAVAADVAAVAWIVAMQHEDCGPCLQITVDHALAEGVDPQLVRATLAGDLNALATPLPEVYRYAEAVVTQDPKATALAERLEDLLGKKVLVDLALGIASARVFPTLKRALGHARSCSLVQVRV
ncbi:MAG: hypothetical protein AAF657_39060 [Acidobacteriota bacterium]